VTCHRFGRSRPVATYDALRSAHKVRRQAALGQSGDRSPHSKELKPQVVESKRLQVNKLMLIRSDIYDVVDPVDNVVSMARQ
jgi:hypothetical protein